MLRSPLVSALRSSALGVCGAVLFAQEPTKPTAKAPVPVFRVDVQGPAAVRAAFLPTNVGSMLASAEGERLWRPLVDQLDAALRSEIGDEAFPASRERFLAFGGRISLVWFLQPGGADASCGALVLDGAGGELLDGLTADLDALLAKAAAGKTEQVKAAGREFTACTAGSDAYTQPQRLGERVVALLAHEVGVAAAAACVLPFLDQQPARAPAAPLTLAFDLGQLLDRYGPSGDDAAAWRDVFGLASLDRLTITLAPRGPRCELQFELAFRHQDRGVFAALMPAVASMPALLARLPKGVTPWKCLALSLPQLCRTTIAAIAADRFGPGAEGLAKEQKEIESSLGFDLDKGFLAQIGDEVLVLGDFWDEGDGPRVAAGKEPDLGFCLVLPVRDDAAFAAGLDKLLAKAAPMFRVGSREQRNGLDVRSVASMFATDVRIASGKGIGAIALGPDGARLLDALVDGKTDADAVKALLDRNRRDQPPGANGVAVADLRALCSGQLPVLMEILGNSVPARANHIVPPELLPELLGQLAPLLAKHHLEQVVSFTGFADDKYRWRLLW